MKTKKAILVTGAAGFIGSALIEKLLKNGEHIIGIDNLNSYYDPSLKISRLERLKKISNNNSGFFSFKKISIEEIKNLNSLFDDYQFKTVVHLSLIHI